MDRSRKANREDQEKTLQFKSKQDAHLLEDQAEEKLRQLLTFITGLERTPPGKVELQHRVEQLGKCQRIEGETSAQYYARLRSWLDRTLPPRKAPLHAPRQIGDEAAS